MRGEGSRDGMGWDGVVKVNGGDGLTLDNPFFPFLFLNRITFLVNKKKRKE